MTAIMSNGVPNIYAVKQNMPKEYYEGVRDGLASFAHWRGGTMHVRTCGTTLQDAIDTVNELERISNFEEVSDCWIDVFAFDL